MTSKEHKITTIKQLFEIANKDNINTLIKDLYISIEYFVELKKIDPNIKHQTFTWIDDCKNDVNFEIHPK